MTQTITLSFTVDTDQALMLVALHNLLTTFGEDNFGEAGKLIAQHSRQNAKMAGTP